MSTRVKDRRKRTLAGLALCLVAEGAVAEERVVELGAHAGIAARPARSGDVTYSSGPTVGGHARLFYLPWLALELSASKEWSSASHEPGALGAEGVTFADQSLDRMVLGASVQPSLALTPRLCAFAGLGVGWGHTSAAPLVPDAARAPSLPGRSAVFLEFPLSAGARYEVVPGWLVITASGAVSLLTAQSGELLEPERTPGPDGTLVTVQGLPEMGTSYALLAGLGLVL